jgi:hypothetical protein
MYNHEGPGGAATLHPGPPPPSERDSPPQNESNEAPPADAPTVLCRPLASILKEHNMRHVDFLSLDIQVLTLLALLVQEHKY